MVVPNGPAAARSASTCIHWWSSVASAKVLICSWVTTRQSEYPRRRPSNAVNSATLLTVVVTLFSSIGTRNGASVSRQDDDGNLALGAPLVLIVVRPDGCHRLPQLRFLLRGGRARVGGKAISFDLDLHLGVGHQVHVPGGRIWSSALGADDQVIITVTAEDERIAVQGTGLAPPGREDQDLGAVAPDVPFLAVCGDVSIDVLSAEQHPCISEGAIAPDAGKPNFECNLPVQLEDPQSSRPRMKGFA